MVRVVGWGKELGDFDITQARLGDRAAWMEVTT
jgi:hypothetical protein